MLGLAALPALASAATDLTPLERQVRHELVLLPYHNLFDNLEFQLNGDQVKLSGQVVRPTTKTAAERVVAKLEGVSSVDNRIEVLPSLHTRPPGSLRGRASDLWEPHAEPLWLGREA